jgi:hypothetical protein
MEWREPSSLSVSSPILIASIARRMPMSNYAKKLPDASSPTMEDYFAQFPKPVVVAEYRVKGTEALLAARTRDWQEAREMNAALVVGEFIRHFGLLT